MIRINFLPPTQENPFGIIKSEVRHSDLDIKSPWEFPLSFQVINKIDGKRK